MKLQIVKPTEEKIVVLDALTGGGITIGQGLPPVYADLDAPAFTYYSAKSAKRLLERQAEAE